VLHQQDSLCGVKLGAKLQNELVKHWREKNLLF